MSYEIKKTLLGKFTVHYACEHCQQTLESPLMDAGETQPCPSCQMPHVVPGEKELATLRQREEVLQQAKQRAEIKREAEKQEQQEKDAALQTDREAQRRRMLERVEAEQRVERTIGQEQAISWQGFLPPGAILALGIGIAFVGGFIMGVASREPIAQVIGVTIISIGAIIQLVGIGRMVIAPLARQNARIIFLLEKGLKNEAKN